tara:strand:+ start:5105 stop:5335 length:231 start_codon:yes stop_codon:yes gene_type:complete
MPDFNLRDFTPRLDFKIRDALNLHGKMQYEGGLMWSAPLKKMGFNVKQRRRRSRSRNKKSKRQSRSTMKKSKRISR